MSITNVDALDFAHLYEVDEFGQLEKTMIVLPVEY